MSTSVNVSIATVSYNKQTYFKDGTSIKLIMPEFIPRLCILSFSFMLTDVFLTLLGNDDSVCFDISSLMTVPYILGLF